MKPVQQFTTVYHAEHGKGKVVSLTPKMKDQLVMCFFPKPNVHEWCLLSALVRDTDSSISLMPIKPQPKEGNTDTLQSALESLLGGGRK